MAGKSSDKGSGGQEGKGTTLEDVTAQLEDLAKKSEELFEMVCDGNKPESVRATLHLLGLAEARAVSDTPNAGEDITARAQAALTAIENGITTAQQIRLVLANQAGMLCFRHGIEPTTLDKAGVEVVALAVSGAQNIVSAREAE